MKLGDPGRRRRHRLFDPTLLSLLFLVLLLEEGTIFPTTQACRCLPNALTLAVSLPNNDSAARINVASEITPAGAGINDSRYWKGEVMEVFKGCTLTKDIVIETGGNSALCGVELKPSTSYLLIGGASLKVVKAFNYEYLVLSISSCTLQKEWESVTDDEKATLSALKKDCPKADVTSCQTCPSGFFDGCNDCACGDDGNLVGCTKRACPPGSATAPRCLDPEPTKNQCCDPMQRPGFGEDFSPCRGEGFQCCPDGQWSCSIGDGRTFPCDGKLLTSGFSQPCATPIVCPTDVKTCPDGSTVSRDPANECRFVECEQRLCTADVKTCPDGSFVSRDPKLGCAFRSCPALDCKTCPFGFSIACNNCACRGGDSQPPICTLIACGPGPMKPSQCLPAPSTSTKACPADAKICYDGSTTSRDPNNNCSFRPCPPPTCSNCPFGFDDGCNQCECNSKTSKAVCTQRRVCLVEGVPKCSPRAGGGCTKDLFPCPNGEKMGRDPQNQCKFFKCPIVRPMVCPNLKACYLINLAATNTTTATTTANKKLITLSGTTKYSLVTGKNKSKYTILCEATGPLNRLTFSFPSNNTIIERKVAPYYMGDNNNNNKDSLIRPVPFLGQGCGRKKITVDGYNTPGPNRCFRKTLALEAVCY